MDAKLYGRGGTYLGKAPGIPDGTRELILGRDVLAHIGIVAVDAKAAAELAGLAGARMLLRPGSTDLFDPAPEA